MAGKRKVKRKKEDNSFFVKRPSECLKLKEGFFILILFLVFACPLEIKMPGQRIAISKKAAAMAQEADEEEIGKRNIKLLFSHEIDPDSLSYTPKKGETFYDICRKFNMCPELFQEINGIADGEKLPRDLKIVPGTFSIVIEIKKNTLTLYRREKFFKKYSVASGRGFSTPLGEYWIMSKLITPPWIFKGKVITSKDPDYPLGTRWMGLSGTRIGIHGTKDPQYIGQYVSSGCVRMFNSDIEELFKIVPFGTKVTIKE